MHDGVRWWVDPQSVEATAKTRGEWLSMAEAARLLDCTVTAVRTLVRRGEVKQAGSTD